LKFFKAGEYVTNRRLRIRGKQQARRYSERLRKPLGAVETQRCRASLDVRYAGSVDPSH